MNVLRLAIALSDVESKKFNKILSSVIINVISSNDQNGKFSTANIQEMISNNYELEFSTSEIEKAIDEDSTLFISYKENNIRFCSLSSKAIEKANNISKNNFFDFDKCIDAFINENKKQISEIKKYNKKIIKDAINSYIYRSFNSDKDDLAYLMRGKLKETPINKKINIHYRK